MMRQRMMRIRHVDLRVGTTAQLVTGHERGDPCAVGLVCQQLQVVHEPRMVREARRNAHRARQQGADMAFKDGIGLEPNGVAVAPRFEQLV